MVMLGSIANHICPCAKVERPQVMGCGFEATPLPSWKLIFFPAESCHSSMRSGTVKYHFCEFVQIKMVVYSLILVNSYCTHSENGWTLFFFLLCRNFLDFLPICSSWSNSCTLFCSSSVGWAMWTGWACVLSIRWLTIGDRFWWIDTFLVLSAKAHHK